MSPSGESQTLSPCRVCGASALSLFAVIDEKTYWRCATCLATLLDEAHFLAAVGERARYETHQNDASDGRYRTFLDRLAAPLIARMPPAQQGLDYGCGPGPLLAMMLTEAGHTVKLWDPFFHRDERALEGTYDFITCTEVVEHFHQPRVEFARLDSLLRPGGLLAVMTTLQTEDARFEQWYYRRDPTHVTFYREFTMRVVAAQHGWTCETPAENVVLFRKG